LFGELIDSAERGLELFRGVDRLVVDVPDAAGELFLVSPCG
jgi:hypothetical protein